MINEQNIQGNLEEILIKQRNKVFSVLLSTFDKELYERDLREEALEEGIEIGEKKKLIAQIKRKLERGKSVEQMADELEESMEVIEDIISTIE